jgi:hypothetical protein
MGSPNKAKSGRRSGVSELDRRLDLAAELLARIAVRIASEKPKPSEDAADADRAEEPKAA